MWAGLAGSFLVAWSRFLLTAGEGRGGWVGGWEGRLCASQVGSRPELGLAADSPGARGLVVGPARGRGGLPHPHLPPLTCLQRTAM